MDLSKERAVYFQRDFFSDSNTIRRLFKSFQYSYVFGQFNEEKFFDRFLHGRCDRLVISNPYRDARSLHLYRRAKALGIPLLVVERGAVPGSIFLDASGFLFDSETYDRRHWNRPLDVAQRDRLERFKHHFTESAKSLEAQPARRSVAEVRERLSSGKERICAITLQMHSDAVVKNFHDPDCDYDAFLRQMGDAIARGKEGWRFAVKSHPREPLSSMGGAAMVNDVNINDLIAASDAVVTFNSGTGIAAFLHDKPVGCFGRAFYGADGLTTKLRGRRDLDRFLDDPCRAMVPDARDRFLFHLLFRVYSEFEFLGPLPGIAGDRAVAMAGRTVRLFDPVEGSVQILAQTTDGLSFTLACQNERLRAWQRAVLNFLERASEL